MLPRAELPHSDSTGDRMTEVDRLWSKDDLYLLGRGEHFRLYRHFGARPSAEGTAFSVWAPNARAVQVVGDFNNWDGTQSELSRLEDSGVWNGTVAKAQVGHRYKYRIISQHNNYQVDKADPYAFFCERPPATASIIFESNFSWGDQDWMGRRAGANSLAAPISIYEAHLASWQRDPAEPDRFLSYRELAPKLAEYLSALHFTHVELMPIMEYPYDPSWGYQITGYFAPSSRFGTPDDFRFFVDTLHRAGIGVILDWVPSHFPSDEHGLVYFDGTHLYEHADPRKGFHPDWKSYIFNYDRHEVRAFLISNALYWLDEFHVDGLRVDAVASMLYLDYSRKDGEWIPNESGGRENTGAVSLLQRLNEVVYLEYPDVQTIAEESTSWPMVSRPTSDGGLGFGMKWDMGWMHDSLKYMALDPLYRKGAHSQLTFRMMYAHSENFVLSISHDEVVHGKYSLLGRMPGSEADRFANLRLLFAYMFAMPGKKLIFMGGEFGQVREWNFANSLDWHLLENAHHLGVQKLVRDLNQLYAQERGLHEMELRPDGFEWIDCSDDQASILLLLRKGARAEQNIAVCLNFTPVPRSGYGVGVPLPGRWLELLNSDALDYCGSGTGNLGGLQTVAVPSHGQAQQIRVTLPPLAAVFFRFAGS